MISIFIKELHKYTYNELLSLFESNEDKLKQYIKKLKQYSILKVSPFIKEKVNLDNINNNFEVYPINLDEKQNFYQFNFVGVVILDSMVLKIYPKYIKKDKEPKSQLKQILKVLEKINYGEQMIKIFGVEESHNSFNGLTSSLFFLNDYFESGLYTNELNILEENGNGEINWERTVNNTFAFINDERPYYTKIYTSKRKVDKYNYFKELHEVIVTLCSEELKKADILDLFDVADIYLSDRMIEEFGDIDYILYRLENEMNIQFNTRKNNLLKMMYQYINNIGAIDELDYMSIFGTNNFNTIWERVCADVLDNHLNTRLDRLPLINNQNLDKSKKLIDIIGKPEWISYDDRGVYFHEANTYIPDTIVIKNNSMLIYDAKYYDLEWSRNSLYGQPGIESITKQYFYYLSYIDFAKKNNIQKIENYFIMPTEEDEVSKKGFVELKIMESLGVSNIEILLLPTKVVFDCFLNNVLFLI